MRKLCLRDSGLIEEVSRDGYTHACTTCGGRISQWLYDNFAGTARWETLRIKRVIVDPGARFEYNPITDRISVTP